MQQRKVRMPILHLTSTSCLYYHCDNNQRHSHLHPNKNHYNRHKRNSTFATTTTATITIATITTIASQRQSQPSQLQPSQLQAQTQHASQSSKQKHTLKSSTSKHGSFTRGLLSLISIMQPRQHSLGLTWKMDKFLHLWVLNNIMHLVRRKCQHCVTFATMQSVVFLGRQIFGSTQNGGLTQIQIHQVWHTLHWK